MWSKFFSHPVIIFKHRKKMLFYFFINMFYFWWFIVRQITWYVLYNFVDRSKSRNYFEMKKCMV